MLVWMNEMGSACFNVFNGYGFENVDPHADKWHSVRRDLLNSIMLM